MHPFTTTTMREWLGGLRGRRVTPADLVVAAMVAYVVVVFVLRFFWSFFPWTMEGDWKQWIWQYHRYFTDGAFPPGHIITDYQFRVQPPLYYVVMAALSHVVHPGVAARLLALLAWTLMLVGTYRATSRRSHWVVGWSAVVFLSHDFHLFISTTGGYPRSFGPVLVLLLLDAWLARRHVYVLAVLVVMAALYPSVLPPCGLAYGGWTFFAAMRDGRRAWLWQVGTLAATAGLCALLALSQNMLALEWWGPVITQQEAEQLPALHRGGRMRWLPHGDFWTTVGLWVTEPYASSGALVHYGLMPWPHVVPRMVGGAIAVALLALAVVRKRRVPWEPLLVIATSVLTYFVARELAFRLYLPVRVLQHVVPYCVIVAAPVLAWQVFLDVRRALLVVLLPMFLLAGDGVLIPAWGDYAHRKEQMTWIEENTPVTAQFAGDIATSDLIPFFAARQVYVNWTMAHPFRLGYWREIERRLRDVHEVMYAKDRRVVLAFIERERIDYLVLDRARFKKPDTGRKLFHPIRDHALELWQRNKRKGFVLANPPAAAVVYSDDRGQVILDAKKLAEAWR